MAQNVTMQLLLEIRQFRQAWEKATTAAKTGARKIVQNTQRSGRAMEKAGKQAKGFAGAMDFLKKRVLGAGLFFAGFYQALITLRQVIGDAVRELFDLDEALRRVQSITGESDASLKRLRGELFDLARQGKLFNQSASEVAESMFTIVQAGFSAAEALTLARVAAEGAAVGFTTAETSAQVLVGTLKAYDLPVTKAREVMDVLFQAVDVGIVTFENLASGLGKVLASAAALDVPLTEVTGAIATMTLRGFTADQAMTSLGRIMQTFIRPSQRAQKAAAEFGIVLDANTISSQGLIATMQQMFIATGGNVNSFSALFDRIQSTRGAISLFSDEGVLLEAVMHEMGLATDGAGRTAAALDSVAKSLNHRLGVLRSQILAVTTQALEPLMGALNFVVTEMSKIMAGQNAIFSYFADMGSLVRALVITFIALKAVALQTMFMSLASSLQMVGFFMKSAAGRTILMKTAMAGLSAALKTMAPVLIFLAAFALMKFGKKLGALNGVVKKSREGFKGLSDSLQQIRADAAEFDLGQVETDLLVTNKVMADSVAMIDSFSGALDNAGGSFNDAGAWLNAYGKSVDKLTGGLVNWGQTSSDVVEDIKLELMGLIETNSLTRDQVSLLADAYAALYGAEAAGATKNFYAIASNIMRLYVEEGDKGTEAVKNAAIAAGTFVDTLGDGVGSADEIQAAIKKWMVPLEKAEEIMEGILGLTSKQDLLLVQAIAPMQTSIAENAAKIAVEQERILELTGLLPDEYSDVEEGTNAILDDGIEQIANLERINGGLELAMESLELQHTAGEAITEETAANEAAFWGVADAIDEGIKPKLMAVSNLLNIEGVQSVQAYLNKFKEAGVVLEEDLLVRLDDLILSAMEGGTLTMDVTEARYRLGLVQSDLANIKGALLAGDLSEAAYRFGVGILNTQNRGYAAGIQNFGGGMAWVGEEGPELLRLPRGSDVIPNNMIGQTMRQTRSGEGGVSVSAEVNITTSMMREYEDLKRRVMQEVAEKLDDAAAEAGLSKPRLGTFGSGIPRI